MVLEVLRGCGFPIRESERRHILIKSLPSRPGRTATPEPHENADVAAERLDGDCGGRSFCSAKLLKLVHQSWCFVRNLNSLTASRIVESLPEVQRFSKDSYADHFG